MSLKLSEIHLRDPFLLPVESDKTYYLYGTDGRTAWKGKALGFDVFRSNDLLTWEGPFPAFRPESGFWADHHYWAPEVFFYRGKYFMFASFKAEDKCRATQILVSEEPTGPFHPHGTGPVTSSDWECLDGTLFIDEVNQGWMVFCREWLQVKDGEMYAVPLTPALDGTCGEPQLLFRASDAPWSKIGDQGQYVTDGPFLHRLNNGQLVMLWSTSGEKGYTMGFARSVSGKIIGPWKQDPTPLYEEDGGHGMIFRDFEGNLRIIIHAPNIHPLERPMIINFEERAVEA